MKPIRRYFLFAIAAFWLVASWFAAGWYADQKTAQLFAHDTESVESDALALYQALEERLNYLAALPDLIAREPSVIRAVEKYSGPSALKAAGTDPKSYWTKQPDLARLNTYLANLADTLALDVVFVLNAEGYAIASSNSDTPGSIVGTDLTDRQYFQAATNKSAHQYAVGRKTNVPGLFYAAPIYKNDIRQGVMVVKSDITSLQSLLAPYHVFLTDNHDVVVLSSETDYLQHRLISARVSNLTEEEKQQQYKRSDFPILSVTAWKDQQSMPLLRLQNIEEPVLVSERQIPGGDLVMHVYQTMPEIATIQRERWVFAFISSLAGLSALSLLYQLITYLQNLRRSKTHAEAEQERLHDTLSARERQLETILDHLPLMVVARDPLTHQILSCNKATQQVLGLDSPLPNGQTYDACLNPKLAGSLSAFDTVDRSSEENLSAREFVSDKKVLLAQNLVATDHKGQPALLIDLVEDVTQKRADEAEIRRLAFIDTLTGLNNRTAFKIQLAHSIQLATTAQEYGALILVDLDAFKQINDRLGHNIGDQLLIELAHRLTSESTDEIYPARLASDEFVVLIAQHHKQREDAVHSATRIANNLLRKLTQPYLLAEHTLHVTASLGIAFFGPGLASSAEQLLIQTDAAMYEAKRKQRGMIQFFDESTQKYLNDQADMANRLRGALNQNVFEQYYQPQVDQRGLVVGVEALLRWHDPVLGQVSPSVFIPLAESLHLIVDIDRWVLKQVCQTLNRWKTDPILSQIVISANVSAEFFSQDGFVDEVCGYLRESKAPPARLMIEMTEGAVVEDTEATLLKMKALHAAGLTIAIDDFGTGNSSLAYLRRFEVDQIKIDQHFVKEMINDQRSQAITGFIIQLAHELGYETLAEGVESQSQKDLLQGLGCKLFQGYLYSKPTNLTECETFILHNNALRMNESSV